MKQTVAVIIRELEALDRQQAFPQLERALERLPKHPPQDCLAAIAYWRGKVALLKNDLAEAVDQLACSARLDPQRSHGHYLLGVALARQKQWLDARQALTLSVNLEPTRLIAVEELASVHAELGDLQAAQDLLTSLPKPGRASLESLKVRVAVAQAADPRAATALVATALTGTVRLRESVLLEWVQIAGGLLLADRLDEGRVWLEALATITPATDAISNPIPRRIALIGLLLLELIQPSRADQAIWMTELRNALASSVN